MKQISILIVLALLTVMVCPFLGAIDLTPNTIINDSNARQIFLHLRLPRTILAFLAGAALSISGVVFQAVFRNPLASPFTLGVSSSAALGAVLSIHLGLSAFASLSAFMFALLSIAVVLLIGVRNSSSVMLLSGVIISFLCGGIISFVHYVSDFQAHARIMRWLVGGFELAEWSQLNLILPCLVLTLILTIYWSDKLDLLSIDDDFAASKGLSVWHTRLTLLLTISLLLACLVAVAGPIGFVGIIIPHAMRALIGSRHRALLIASALAGASFLSLSDAIARTVMAPFEIPVGVITSLIGAPAFLWILLSKRSNTTQ
jgi:iron complex transport system permease protein